MTSLSVFFLKFMLAGFSVLCAKTGSAIQQILLPPPILCRETADFFFPLYASILFRYSLGLSILPAWQKHFQFVAFM